MALEMKKALITASGIVVDGNVFTCFLAIKEQWFIKVMDTGPIEVDFTWIHEIEMRGFYHLMSAMRAAYVWSIPMLLKKNRPNILSNLK